MKKMTEEEIVKLLETFQFNVPLGTFGMGNEAVISFVPASNYKDFARFMLELTEPKQEFCECGSEALIGIIPSDKLCARCDKPAKPTEPKLPKKLDPQLAYTEATKIDMFNKLIEYQKSREK